MPKVSFIIPVYNTEKYLTRCLDSISAQTDPSFEALLIDDGSTDASADICKQYAERDDRFKYFYQENKGVSAARNLGIDSATGEYIAFVDSDDAIESHYIIFLHHILKETKVDVAGFGFRTHFLNNASSLKNRSLSLSCVDESNFLAKYCRNWLDFKQVYTWCKIYDREFLLASKIRFNESLNFSEDRDFIFRLGIHSRNMIFVPDALYKYIFRSDSAVKAPISVDGAESLLRQYLTAYQNYSSYWLQDSWGKHLEVVKPIALYAALSSAMYNAQTKLGNDSELTFIATMNALKDFPIRDELEIRKVEKALSYFVRVNNKDAKWFSNSKKGMIAFSEGEAGIRKILNIK